MNRHLISAAIVTRGGEDLSPIVDGLRLAFDDVVVWDNSIEPDRKVYGRFLAIDRCKHDFIYTQDDDCRIYKAGYMAEAFVERDDEIVCNVPSRAHREGYEAMGLSLVGWGAIFHRDLADFRTYLDRFPMDALFERECDRVFTGLNKIRNIDVGMEHLASARAPNRMYLQPGVDEDFAEIRRRIAEVKRT